MSPDGRKREEGESASLDARLRGIPLSEKKRWEKSLGSARMRYLVSEEVPESFSYDSERSLQRHTTGNGREGFKGGHRETTEGAKSCLREVESIKQTAQHESEFEGMTERQLPQPINGKGSTEIQKDGASGKSTGER